MKKIIDPNELHDEFIKIGFTETTYNELLEWKQYGIECDKDPRWKMKFRIYKSNDLFWVIFEKDGHIYSSKGFGWPQPNVVDKLLNKVQWSDNDYDYDQF